MTADDRTALRARLGRVPTPIEAEVAASLWSEHSAYRHSRAALARLDPPVSPAWRGAHAGGIVVDGVAIGAKIESHNHPSAVDPVEGAATGVGGVLRDLLAEGLRPVALADGLAFGPLDEPRSRANAEGIVRGISWYANTVGVPTVAGSTHAHELFRGRPLVNILAVGVGDPLPLRRARWGDLLLLAGAPADATGLGGGRFASQPLAASRTPGRAHRSAIQRADPLLGWRLLRAIPSARAFASAAADLGAAGLAGAAYEIARATGIGVRIDLDRVPTRGRRSAREVLLSETQERMLFALPRSAIGRVARILAAEGIPYALVGRLDGSALAARARGRTRLDLPLGVLADPPPRDRPATWRPLAARPARHAWRDAKWIHDQYDWGVGGGTLLGPGRAEAGLVRVRHRDRTLDLAVALRARPIEALRDSARAAATATRAAVFAVRSVGARPILLVDGLNVGDPERDPAMAAISESLRGLADAARAEGIPVVAGNVSCYNAFPSPASDVPPTLFVGCVGIVKR